MLFIYVFTLLGSTTVWTRDAKDGKQGAYYWAISLAQTGLIVTFLFPRPEYLG